MNTFLERVEEGKAYSRKELDAIGFQIKGAHMVALDAAGKTGSAVHGWIEAYLAARSVGRGYPAPPADPKVRSACSAARSWIQEVDLRPMAVEKILYSRMYGFIGTMDLSGLVTIGGKTAAIDWKSSNRLARSYELQLAAYQLMYEEMFGSKLEDRWLIRLDKEDSAFEAKCLSTETAQDEQDAFVMLATAYKLLEGMNFFEE
jgi:PD-(D/E)XK nuclease superfamily